MKALVTGACGFVGGHLVRHLINSGDEVLGAYLGDIVDVVPQCRYEKLDVRNFEECSRVIGVFGPDVIYHLAGIAFVPEAEKNFDTTLSINVTGVHNVLRIPHLLKRKTTVVFISSAEVYGRVDPASLPITEECVVNPTNNYSLSKLFGEMVVQRYAGEHFIQPVIIRPFNHIGPGQNNRFVASSFAWQLARIARGFEKPILKVGNLDARRDFSDVRDIVRGYRLAATKGHGLYNLASGNPVSIQEILDMLIKISGLSITIERDTDRMRPSEMPIVYGASSKAARELGWIPELNLETTLTDIFQYWLKAAVK